MFPNFTAGRLYFGWFRNLDLSFVDYPIIYGVMFTSQVDFLREQYGVMVYFNWHQNDEGKDF